MLQETQEIRECLFQMAVSCDCPKGNYTRGGLGEYLITHG